MRILHVVEAWQGGVATYVKSLIDAQVRDGHIVRLAADGKSLLSDDRNLLCEVVVYRASRSFTKIRGVQAHLRKIISDFQPDIVHAHSSFAGAYLRFLHAIHTHIIYTPHGWSFFRTGRLSWVSNTIYGWLECYLAHQCDAIICMSLQEIDAARDVGIADSKLVLIQTGIPDQNGYAVASQEAPRDHCLNVGFFGRLDYQKGADLLVQIANGLRGGTKIHIFGSAVRAAPTNVDHKNIVNHGWVAHSEIGAKMREMDVIVIPSRWEGFSLTALEAMRSAVPIVVSNVTSLGEVVVHGYNGMIMKTLSAAAAIDLLNNMDVSDCRRMGYNARRVYEETFGFDHFYDRVMTLYERVLSS